MKKNNSAYVFSVNISKKKGTVKTPVSEITVTADGIAGDAHAGKWHRQVSLLGWERVEQFSAKTGRKPHAGEFAENITTCGIDLHNSKLLDRFRIGSVELEVTQIGKACHGKKCAIYQEVGNCIMPKEGIFCRVLKGGKIKSDDTIVYDPRILKCLVITLSDRAALGHYKDRSGHEIRKLLENYFHKKPWRAEISHVVLPDDAHLLKTELSNACSRGIDCIFTTGGTGIGSRDITPDVVLNLVNKTIPGIMEHIRTKYGDKYPPALLSRSVAGIKKNSLIYTLPGSVKAVDEYMQEILKTLEHCLFMIHDIDVHHGQ